MVPSHRLTILAAAVAAIGLGAISASADTPITSFTPGDLVVLRGGDAQNLNTTSTTSQVPLYLDEYTTAGLYVGTIAMPSTGGNALTLPGIGDEQHEGLLSLSTNGQLLSLAGYQAAAGSADAFVQAGTSQYQPVIGVVGSTASSLSTNTVVNSYDNGSSNPYIRGAVTNDGTSFWTFGKYAASGGTSNGGLSYVSGTGLTATTTTVEGFADWRDIILVNGQMYGGTGSSSVGTHAPYVINNSFTSGQLTNPVTEPTSNLGTSLSLNTQVGAYPGGQSASALAMLKVPGDSNLQNGVNVMYTIGDQSTAGIVKYYFDGTAWQNFTDVELNPTDVTNPTGLVAVPDPSNANWVDLYVSGNNGIYMYVDKGGYNGAIPADAFTMISAPAGEAFYGMALAPSGVPEPASLALLGMGAAGLILRRRKV